MMRILLDECVPTPLKQALSGLEAEVCTMVQIGWLGKRNGQLLALMQQEKFSALITVDKSLQYQQNIGKTSLSVIVLSSKSSDYEDLLPLVPAVYVQMEYLEPGKVYVIK